jgi:hypothetical protein
MCGKQSRALIEMAERLGDPYAKRLGRAGLGRKHQCSSPLGQSFRRFFERMARGCTKSSHPRHQHHGEKCSYRALVIEREDLSSHMRCFPRSSSTKVAPPIFPPFATQSRASRQPRRQRWLRWLTSYGIDPFRGILRGRSGCRQLKNCRDLVRTQLREQYDLTARKF